MGELGKFLCEPILTSPKNIKTVHVQLIRDINIDFINCVNILENIRTFADKNNFFGFVYLRTVSICNYLQLCEGCEVLPGFAHACFEDCKAIALTTQPPRLDINCILYFLY